MRSIKAQDSVSIQSVHERVRKRDKRMRHRTQRSSEKGLCQYHAAALLAKARHRSSTAAASTTESHAALFMRVHERRRC